jgi:hypothetical protein
VSKRVWRPQPYFAQRQYQKRNIPVILWRTVGLQLLPFFAVILLSTVFQSSAYCLESAGQILDELDTHYYFPQKQGLQKLSVRMEWEQLDVVTDSGMYLKNPPVDFFWENSPAGSKSVFKLADRSFEVSKERQQELLNTLENYKEIVIPQTLEEKMANYKGQIKVVKKQKRLVEFVSRKAGADIGKFGLIVDLGLKNVRKIIIERKNAPFQVESDIRYSQKDGKWLIAESRSKFRVGEMKYQETTEYVYRRAGKFWLVGKMSQTLKMDNRVLQSFIFRFRDYKVN